MRKPTSTRKSRNRLSSSVCPYVRPKRPANPAAARPAIACAVAAHSKAVAHKANSSPRGIRSVPGLFVISPNFSRNPFLARGIELRHVAELVVPLVQHLLKRHRLQLFEVLAQA